MNPPCQNWILAIEDSDSDMYLLQRALDANANLHLVRRARNGEQAIELLHDIAHSVPQSLPDLILIDLNLPRIDGHEVLQYLQAQEVFKEIPVMVLTSSQAADDRKRALAGGADSFFVKPMDIASYRRLPDAIEDARRARWAKLKRLPVGD